MTQRAYRGPANREFISVSDKTVTGALLPCTFVTETATAFTQATAFGPNLRLLINRDFYAPSADFFNTTNPLLSAYVSGETGIAALLEPGRRWLVAVAAATYTFGQEITVGALGRGAGAIATNVVVGFAREAGVRAAGDLLEVEICMHYVRP
jgi:hypothetical protein